jgi:hypothetical protein
MPPNMSEVYWRDLQVLLRFYPNHQPWGATCALEYFEFLDTVNRQFKFEKEMELYRVNTSDLPWEIFRMVVLMTGLHLSDHHYPLTFHGVSVAFVAEVESLESLALDREEPFYLPNLCEDEEMLS